MAAGLPVVVTDTTPWSEVNAQGFGWCVPWSTYPTALSAALACQAAELRNRGERARTWVFENFSWETSAAKLLGFYAELRRSLASKARA
jgi:glycosyltransferase involved in cell wall biosynthesis